MPISNCSIKAASFFICVLFSLKKHFSRFWRLFLLLFIELRSKGMSVRDIEDSVREIYGADVSPMLVSKITDKILPEVNEWQNRPLDEIYPIVYFDGIVFKSRKDNQIINRDRKIPAARSAVFA